MSYQKHNFASKQKLTAVAMNEIEDGIIKNESDISSLSEKIVQPDLAQNDDTQPDYVKGKESFVTKNELAAAITGAMEASY